MEHVLSVGMKLKLISASKIRMSEEEKDEFRAEAHRRGLSLSAWIRQVLRRETGFGCIETRSTDEQE